MTSAARYVADNGLFSSFRIVTIPLSEHGIRRGVLFLYDGRAAASAAHHFPPFAPAQPELHCGAFHGRVRRAVSGPFRPDIWAGCASFSGAVDALP